MEDSNSHCHPQIHLGWLDVLEAKWSLSWCRQQQQQQQHLVFLRWALGETAGGHRPYKVHWWTTLNPSGILLVPLCILCCLMWPCKVGFIVNVAFSLSLQVPVDNGSFKSPHPALHTAGKNTVGQAFNIALYR